jgi:heme exporter protein CcmD
MELGPYASFIVIAYALAALVFVLLIGWVVVDHRALKHSLEELEMRGVTRRSDRGGRKTS